MALCGAKTRNGKPCKSRAMANGRCRMHGGKSTGPKDKEKLANNQNARTHGIYSDAIDAEEKELWEVIELGSLDDEIKLAKLQLRRARIAQQKADAGDGLDLDTESETVDVNIAGEFVKTTTVRTKRPYEDIINRLLGRIGDLEVKRAELINKSGGSDDMASLISELIENLPS